MVRATRSRTSAPAAEPEPREFQFSAKDFQRVRDLIYMRAGISLSDAKQDMVYSRLARRLRARGLKRFSDYLALLHGGDEREWEAFTNALTTNLTSFFREAHHFPILAEHVQHQQRGRRIEIWSCASSTGEEPYSIAITMAETFGSLTPPISVLATDIDTQGLAQAEEGIYPLDRVERLGAERLKRFFLRGTGPQAGQARVRPDLRSLITFRRLNLLDPAWPVRSQFDAIFCRNVMIYFDRPTQEALVARFTAHLRPGGHLLIGHSESLNGIQHSLQYVQPTIYERAEP